MIHILSQSYRSWRCASPKFQVPFLALINLDIYFKSQDVNATSLEKKLSGWVWKKNSVTNFTKYEDIQIQDLENFLGLANVGDLNHTLQNYFSTPITPDTVEYSDNKGSAHNTHHSMHAIHKGYILYEL